MAIERGESSRCIAGGSRARVVVDPCLSWRSWYPLSVDGRVVHCVGRHVPDRRPAAARRQGACARPDPRGPGRRWRRAAGPASLPCVPSRAETPHGCPPGEAPRRRGRSPPPRQLLGRLDQKIVGRSPRWCPSPARPTTRRWSAGAARPTVSAWAGGVVDAAARGRPASPWPAEWRRAAVCRRVGHGRPAVGQFHRPADGPLGVAADPDGGMRAAGAVGAGRRCRRPRSAGPRSDSGSPDHAAFMATMASSVSSLRSAKSTPRASNSASR